MMDVKNGEGCFRLQFIMGEPDLYISSNTSNAFCYKNDYKFSIMSSYSKIIGEQQLFANLLGITVALNPVLGNDFSDETLFVFSALPASINGESIKEEEAEGYSKKYLKNNKCIFVGDFCLIGSCYMDQTTYQRDKPLSINIYFDNLSWNKPTIKDTFSLTFVNYYQSSSAPNSSQITVTTTPNIIEIRAQPPERLKIGEIFQITVFATLGDGLGLSKATITANVSQDIKVSELDQTSVDSLINLFGNQDISINSLAQLTRDSRVALDPSRATATTNTDGEAKMNLKLTAGKPGTYSIVFQSENVQSPPSNSFYLDNPISEVMLINTDDFVQTINVHFEEKDGEYLPSHGNLTTTPILQLKAVNSSYSNDITNRSSEFEIFIIEHSSVEATKRAMEEKGLDASKNISLYDIYTYSTQQEPQTSKEELVKLWEAISTGAQTVGGINQEATDLDIYFPPPQETQNTTYNFSVYIYYIYIYI